jgi:simple sugar transport system ATP-binding protein
VLLISEDLDELLALSDRVAVMFRGALSQPMPREKVTIQSLGLMMAGQGFQHAA